MQKIYLAGPDVFLPNAIEEGKRLKALCQSYGFEGLFPMDNIITGQTPKEIALKIKEANQEMIYACDIVIANLSPFRGPEPDSGTVWEVGFAQALGKTVLAYSTDMRSLKEKTQDLLDLGHSDVDRAGMSIEDFGLSHNLMFAECLIADNFEACLKRLGCSSEISSQEIIQLGNPLLRQYAKRVEEVNTREIQTLIKHLIDTCQSSKGVGIAAPQIGISQAIMIMASYPSERYPHAPMMEPTALINPQLVAHSDTKEKDWEGCLSIPGIRALIPRYEWVEVSFTNVEGVDENKHFDGFLARIFLHEFDHLIGKVFIDHIESTQDIVTEQVYRSLMLQSMTHS